jgi:HTH-type transcriptional regulator/antitoxin HigA
MDNIKPIKTDADLAWAISEIEPYFDALPEAGMPEADRFDVLADLIEACENRHFPIDDLEPVVMLRAFMGMTARSQGDLAELFGSRSRASKSSIASGR